MMNRAPGHLRQRGVALFAAIFLVVAIALVAAVVALTTTTQQTGAARSFDQEQAYYAAMARLDEAVAIILDDNSTAMCEDVKGDDPVFGFDTDMVVCDDSVCAQEGGDEFRVFTLRARAVRGDLESGTLVRRSVRTQFVREDESC